MLNEEGIAKIRADLREIVKKSEKMCHWCAKGSKIRKDGRHVHMTCVVDGCSIEPMRPILQIIKKVVG